MTAHATVESAIEAMKLGALDYLQKPFEIDELLVVVRRAVELQRLRGEHRYLLSERDEEFDHYGIVGRSQRHAGGDQHARARGRDEEHGAHHRRDRHRQGAGGAGHPRPQRASATCRSSRSTARPSRTRCSSRSCSATCRGAFTGAAANKKGKFALAARRHRSSSTRSATLGPAARRRSCCACCRSGSSSRWARSASQKVDVRVIAATNRDLRQMVAEGRFQEDLFYRLNVIPIRIPPLRERREDIAGAGRALRRQARPAQRAARAAARTSRPSRCSSSTDWPGNVRELENTIERAVVLSRETGDRRRRHLGAARRRAGRAGPALDAPAPEPRVGGARDDPARARGRRRRQEGRRRTDGHQPARAEPLPRQAPPVGSASSDRFRAGVTAYACRKRHAAAHSRPAGALEFPPFPRHVLRGTRLAFDAWTDPTTEGAPDAGVASMSRRVSGAGCGRWPLVAVAGRCPRRCGPTAPAPRAVTVEMIAKRFAFLPEQVEVVEGDEVTINVGSADGTHGIEIGKLKVKKAIPRGGEVVTLSFTAPAPGRYAIDVFGVLRARVTTT
ncbi:MAG: sigma 54-interacting transcriptional regulator [Sphingobacterium sp.]|nr:sigma 54-interacting transcriptional regulator [Sphingobacterium sp.]